MLTGSTMTIDNAMDLSYYEYGVFQLVGSE